MAEPLARVEIGATGPAPAAAARRPFHGWRIVLVGAVVQGLGVGLIGVYGFVVSPIAREFGASDAQLGMGMSISIFSIALVSPIVGPLLDRGPIRLLMAAGVGVMLASVWGLAQGTALWHLALGFAFCSVGFALYGPLPSAVLLVNWFVLRRGRALAVAGLGYSLGSFVVPPLAAFLVTRFGWRGAVTTLATAAAAIVLPVVLRFVVKRPEEMGQRPDGLPAIAGPATDVRGSVVERSVAEIARDRNFWLLGLGMGIAHCVPIAGLFLVRHMEGFGIPAERAALAFMVMGAFGIIGKLASGALADRFDERLVTLGVLAIYAVSWLAMATSGSLGSVLLASVPMGLGAGGLVPLGPMLIGACFGRAVVGRITGLQAALGLPFLLGSAPLVGLARDRTGDYAAAFLGLAALVVLAAGVLALLRLPKRAALDPAR